MNAADFIKSSRSKPWVNRAEGPDSYDCWGLVMASYRNLDGIELPQIGGYCDSECETDIAFDEAMESGLYRESQPCDGAIMAVYRNGRVTHVGRCLCGGVLHALKGSRGVEWHPYRALNRIFAEIKYFQYVG